MLASDKVVLFIGDPRLIPVMNMLHYERKLAAVVIHHHQNALAQQLLPWCQQEGILCLIVDGNYTEEQLSWLRAAEAYLGLALGFELSWLAPVREHLSDDVYRLGVIDLEFNQTPDTPYWILARQAAKCQLVLEKNCENDVRFCVLRELSISSHDTCAYVENRLFANIDQLIYEHIKSLENHTELKWAASNGSHESLPPPAAIDLQVNWQRQTASDISAMARAGNPFGGCILTLNNVQVGVLEATPCDYETWHTEAGTICHSGEPHGLIVATKDGALRLEVLNSGDGVFSAKRFSEKFVIEAGMQFSIHNV